MKPNLTSTVRSLIIPEKAKVSVHVLESEYRDIKQTPIAPSKGPIVMTIDPAEVPYTFGDGYQSEGWLPSEPAWSARTYILRDYHGADIELCPFQYDPQTQTLRAYTRMVVEITTDGGVPMQTSGTKTAVRAFTEIYADHFINFHAVTDKYTLLEEQGDMLIVAVDEHCDALAPFIEWKEQKGIKVTLVPVPANIPVSQVQAIIQDAYDTNPALAFVLIVADGGQIYAPIGGYSRTTGPCDPIYARVAGDDDYPDVIIGRFSDAQPANIAKILQHGIYYERDLVDNGSADWLTRSLGIATDEYGCTSNMRDLLSDLAQYGYTVDSLYEKNNHNPSSQLVINALENGRGYVNYAGHGSDYGWATTGYGLNEISQTENTWKLPFLVSNACLTGAFDWGCFSESLLKATDDNGDPTGAVAIWACSREADWDMGAQGQDEVANLIMNGSSTTFGGLCFDAATMLVLHGGTPQAEIWTVFGDPSLMIRTAVPGPLTAQHSHTVDWDGDVYTVTVTDPDTEQPVEGVSCALYCGGALHGCAFTNANGLATIPLDPNSPMFCNEATLTLTGYNRETVQETVLVFHDITVSVDPIDDSTRLCIENDEGQEGYWVECEMFSGYPVNGTPEVTFTTGHDGSFPPPVWTTLLLSDLGNNKWGRFLPLQHTGSRVRFAISANNTHGDQYETPEQSFFVISRRVEIATDSSMQSGFQGKMCGSMCR